MQTNFVFDFDQMQTHNEIVFEHSIKFNFAEYRTSRIFEILRGKALTRFIDEKLQRDVKLMSFFDIFAKKKNVCAFST